MREMAEEEEEEESEEKEFTEEDAMEICYRVCNSMRKYFTEDKQDDDDEDDDEYESIRRYYVKHLIDDDDEVCYSLCEDSTSRQRDLKLMRATVHKLVRPEE
ncbi:MAG: hypothetical protein QXK11_10725 [Pyrobaculum sp.]|uniref:hypothetical protein n=1 Tax=Pyrobaculum sp. TaxID=2004705 RepID=UPI00316E92CE